MRSVSLLCVGLDSDINQLPEQWIAQPAPQYVSISISLTSPGAQLPPTSLIWLSTKREVPTAGATWPRHSNTCTPIIRCIHHLRCQNVADIGNSSAAYARAIFDQLGFDAVTLNPFLGSDACKPFLDYRDKACVILCRTSNKGSGEFQNQDVAGKKLWLRVAEIVAEKMEQQRQLYVGGSRNLPNEMAEIRASVGEMTLLVPGIGGARWRYRGGDQSGS